MPILREPIVCKALIKTLLTVWLPALPISLALIGCAAGPRATVSAQPSASVPVVAGSVVHVSSGLSFPVVLGELSRKEVHDYEVQSAGMGFGYLYQGHGATQGVDAIVYVYNLRVQSIPTDLKSSMMAQIRQMTRREIAHQAELQSLRPRPVFGNTLKMESEGRPMEALFDGFILESLGVDGTPLPKGYHFSALWVAKNHFIKVKVLRSGDSAATPAQLGAFVQAVLAQTQR
jgi:hypothetical protein